MSVIEINNLVTLQAMAALTDWSGDTYIQTDDIDLLPTQDADYGTSGDTYGVGDLGNASGEGWFPIGDATNYFNANYDGQGFKMTGSYINRPAVGVQGIFGTLIEGCMIKNLTVENCNHTGFNHVASVVSITKANLMNCHASGEVHGNYHNVGGLCTKVDINSTITNCSCSTDVYQDGTGDYAGGFCATISGKVFNCSASGNVTSLNGSNGGFVGSSSGDNHIARCHAIGNVYGVGGGFGGWMRGGITEDCYATGDIIEGGLKVSGVGGFVGALTNSAQPFTTIRRCYATGNINRNYSSQAGFIGSWDTGDGEIEDCFCSGNVGISSHGNSSNGGFSGKAGTGYDHTIKRCYSTGRVWSTYSDARGFCSDVDVDIEDCYYDQTLSGKTDNDGHGVPLVSLDAKDSFANWDFNTIWKMLSVPMLRSLLNMNDAYSHGQNDAYGGDNNDAYGNGDNDIYNCRLNRVY